MWCYISVHVIHLSRASWPPGILSSLTNLKTNALAQTQYRRNSILVPSSECYFFSSIQYSTRHQEGTLLPVNDDDDYTAAFLNPKRKLSKTDEPLLRPSKINSPNRNNLHKEALKTVAHNKNILLWLQMRPSHNFLNVKLVSMLIKSQSWETICTRGRNPTDWTWDAPIPNFQQH